MPATSSVTMGGISGMGIGKLFGRGSPGDRESPGTDTGVSREAVSLAQQGRFHEAIGCFDRVIEEDPTNVKMLNNKGVFLDLLGRDPEALAC